MASVSLPRDTGVPERTRGARGKAVLTWARQVAAASGAACIAVIALRPAQAEAVATLAFGFLCLSALLLATELLVSRHRSELVMPTARHESDASSLVMTYALVGVLAALMAQTWFRWGEAIAGGDMTPPQGVAWTSRLFAAWTNSTSSLGGPAAQETLLPWSVILRVTTAFGDDGTIAQRIWITVLFTGAAVATAALLHRLGFGTIAMTVGAGVYALSPYVVSTVVPYTVQLAALAAVPLFPTVVLLRVDRRIGWPTYLLLMMFLSPLLGFVSNNPPLALAVLATAVSLPALTGIGHDAARAIRAFRTGLLGVAACLVLSAYWLVPTLIQSRSAAVDGLAPLSSWTWTEGRATLANAFWLNTNWGWAFPSYFPFAGSYETMPLRLLRYLVPVSAFAALVLVVARRQREAWLVVAWGLLALVLLLLSTGTNQPGARVFLLIYSLPLGWLLREPGRFLILAGLAYAVMAGVVVERWRAFVSLRKPGERWLRYGALAAGAVIGVVALSPAYPLVTGEVVPAHRPGLPPMTSKLPDYWNRMAAAVDAAKAPGNLLAMPPDDVYQMPFTWGYYGSDDFMSNLMARNVIAPTGTGYVEQSSSLVTDVHQVADALVGGRRAEARAILRVLAANLVLVRGDIDANAAGRQILDPRLVAQALSKSPDFELIAQQGPLELYQLRPPWTAGTVDRASSVYTINTARPDLRMLPLLEPGSHVVTSSARPELGNILQFPPLTSWRLDGNKLALTTPMAISATSRMLHIDNGSGARWMNASSEPLSITTPADKTGRRRNVTISLGRDLLPNGDFAAGPWQTSPSDCNDILGPAGAAHLTASVVGGQVPNQRALQLRATADAACEGQLAAWRGGSVMLNASVRAIGTTPRFCILQRGPETCARLPAAAPGDGRWHTYRALVNPAPGTTALTVIVYAETSQTSHEVMAEYADVRLVTVPQAVADLAVLALVTPPPPGPSNHLLVSHTTFSGDWSGPANADHVLVDGLLNGWLSRSEEITAAEVASVKYSPQTLVASSFATSAVAAAMLSLVAVGGLCRRRWRGRRLREGVSGLGTDL